MSISKIRSAFDSKGCQVLLIVVGVLVAAGLILPGVCTSMMGAGPMDSGPGAAIGKVRGTNVSERVAMQFVTAARQRFEEQARETGAALEADPGREFRYYVLGAQRALSATANDLLATQKGVSLDQARTDAMLERQWQDALDELRLQLVGQQKLSVEDPPAKFEEVVEKEIGRPLADLKVNFLASVRARLQDPETSMAARAELVQRALVEHYAGTVPASEADLKASYDTLDFERFTIGKEGQSVEEKMEAAEKAVAEVRGGKTLEEALKAHSPETKPTPLGLPRQFLTQIEAYKPLAGLKPGEVSEPLEERGEVLVYRLKGITSNLPPTYEQDKARLLTEFRRQRAQQQLNDDRVAIEKEVEWASPVYQVAFDLDEALAESGPEAVARVQDLAEQLAVATSEDFYADRLKKLGTFVGLSRVYPELSPKEQAEMRPALIEAYEEVLGDVESAKIRLQLYALLLAEDNAEGAAQQLLEAARVNTDFLPANVITHGEIKARLAEARQSPRFRDLKEALDDVQTELDKWTAEKSSYEKEQREAEEERKQLDREIEEMDREDAEKAGTTSAMPTAPNPTGGGPGN